MSQLAQTLLAHESDTAKPSFYYVTGRKDTGTHLRFEIEDLRDKQPLQFSLFILAYLALQGRRSGGDPRVDSLYDSIEIPPAAQFHELAGIHGLPFEVISTSFFCPSTSVLMILLLRNGSVIKLAKRVTMTPRISKTLMRCLRGLEGCAFTLLHGAMLMAYLQYCNHGSVVFPTWYESYESLET